MRSSRWFESIVTFDCINVVPKRSLLWARKHNFIYLFFSVIFFCFWEWDKWIMGLFKRPKTITTSQCISFDFAGENLYSTWTNKWAFNWALFFIIMNGVPLFLSTERLFFIYLWWDSVGRAFALFITDLWISSCVDLTHGQWRRQASSCPSTMEWLVLTVSLRTPIKWSNSVQSETHTRIRLSGKSAGTCLGCKKLQSRGYRWRWCQRRVKSFARPCLGSSICRNASTNSK